MEGPTIGLYSTPTPNATNNSQVSYTGYAPRVLFSLAAGFYAGTQNVSLSCPDPNVVIRYTTNGTVPTAASTAYTGPIPVAALPPFVLLPFTIYLLYYLVW
jgi:hypothetical protein